MRLNAVKLIAIVACAFYMTPFSFSQSCEEAGIKARNTQYGLYLERKYKPIVTDVQSFTYGGKVRYPKELVDGLMMFDCTYQDYMYDPRRSRFFEDDYGSVYLFVASLDHPFEVFIKPDGSFTTTADLGIAYYSNRYPVMPYLYKIPQSDIDLVRILLSAAIEEDGDYRKARNQTLFDAAASIDWLEKLLMIATFNQGTFNFMDRDGNIYGVRAAVDTEFDNLAW